MRARSIASTVEALGSEHSEPPKIHNTGTPTRDVEGRAAAMATFAGLSPTALVKLRAACQSAPSSPQYYRSMLIRPMVSSSASWLVLNSFQQPRATM
jgi:hypothetical protein